MSGAAKPSPEVPKNSSRSREEGEVSSSDDDDDTPPPSSISQLSRGIAARAETKEVTPANKNVPCVKAEKCTSSTDNPAKFADPPPKTSEIVRSGKKIEKSRGPFVPFLISFSDDDSGSEPEDCRQGKISETRGNSLGGEHDRRVADKSQHKSQIPKKVVANETKAIPRKLPLPLPRPSASPLTNFNGATSMDDGRLLNGQRSRVKNFNTSNRSFYGRKNADNQNGHVNTSKLQDLRQQIAIRETELKLKSSQQSKERVSGSHKDYNLVNVNNDTAMECRGASANFVQSKPKEPDRKRLKISEPSPSHLNSDDRKQMPSVRPTLASETTVAEHRVEQKTNKHISHGKGIQVRQTSIIAHQQKKHENQDPISVGNLPTGVKNGIDLITNSSQSDRNTKLVIPSTKQTKRGPDGIVKNIPDKSASLNDGSIWNCLGNVNVPGSGNMNMASLLDIEELQDKELEGAQEYRRQCEIEERNALKAYRKAQKALIEANARCSYLYRKRELYSAHLRSLMMEGSSLFWSAGQDSQVEAGLNSSNNVSDGVHLAPTSGHPVFDEFDAYNQRGYGSNIQSADEALQSGSNKHVNEHNVASDPCSEHDASTSEPHRSKAVGNELCSPSGNLDTSGDEAGETLPFDQRSHPQGEKEIHEDREKENNYDANKKIPCDRLEDSLLLEASLRSQLFARLQMKNLPKKGGPSRSVESTAVRQAVNDDGVNNLEVSAGNMLIYEKVKGLYSDFGDRSIPELPLQINESRDVEKSSEYGSISAADPLNNRFLIEGCQSTKFNTFSCPILRGAFGHMKAADLFKVSELQAREQGIHSCDIYNESSIGILSDVIEPRMLSLKSMEEGSMEKYGAGVGSYTCNLAVDPVWPLCMYELRGKCNNDECSLQHVKDYSCTIMNHDGSDSCDSQVVSPCHRRKYGAENVYKCVNIVSAPPTYIVTSDILKDDLHSYKPVSAQSSKQCWRKCFSTFLVLSGLFPTHFLSDEPILHSTAARIEVHGSWNRQSLYFHGINGKMDQVDLGKADTDQFVEAALLNISQEADKKKGRLEALKVLARALEVEPKSVLLWTVYIHIYYSNDKSNAKDDMFHCAIESNKGSYQLWLMYINSRIQLSDWLAAYETALSVLCHVPASPDQIPVHDSACILDLFLQMMNSFCISGNISKAIEKTYGLLRSSSRNSNDHHHSLLSDILPCLTIADKCIFWICCVYLVIYKKLPYVVVHQFEREKEPSDIEWPSADLTPDERQHAVTLMELAVDSLGSYIDCESPESENIFRAAHMFSINHIRCITVLEGPECSRNLLDKYTKLYPSCLELALMSARSGVHDCVNLNFLGFEEALRNWQEEVPGVHCILNQYVECALESEKFDLAREVMDRWLDSVRKYSEDGGSDRQIDVLFELLNFSLRDVLHNDQVAGRSAIDRALKVAGPEYYKHCVREHAMFLRMDSSVGEIVPMLRSYLVDERSCRAYEPLSRSSIGSIKRPRLRQLVSNIWSPVSSDFSLVNSVLEVWHGPSLLPPRFGKINEIVDFVESVMEIVPANYPLAMSVCKLLSGGGPGPAMNSPPSVTFWATSLLIDSLFQAVPVPPEYVWVEVAEILVELTNFESIAESYHKRALSVYPFSIKLWKSCLKLSRAIGKVDAVVEAAKERGIDL